VSTKIVTDALFEFKLKRNECNAPLYKLKSELLSYVEPHGYWQSLSGSRAQQKKAPELLVQVNTMLNELAVIEYKKGPKHYEPYFSSVFVKVKEIRSKLKQLA
jgi:hypothetical protein